MADPPGRKESTDMIIKKLIVGILTGMIFLSILPVCSFAEEAEYLSDTIEKYAQFDYSDPDDIADDVLFGVWENDAWTKEPYFRYDEYPEMEKIEEAAKNGEYELCKEELLAYYREKVHEFPISLTNNVNKTNEMIAELYAHNMFKISSPIEGFDLEENGSWNSANVTSLVKSGIKLETKYINIGAVALEKDGYTARIASKENEQTDEEGNSLTPYILATVNGVDRIFYPSDDTYVAADANEGINFGTEPWLLAEESTTTIETTLKWDQYTKKVFIRFDFGELSEDDVIQNATFNFWADYVESDNPNNKKKEINDKAMYLYTPSEPVWTEETLTWRNMAAYVGISYDGEKGPTAYEAGSQQDTNWFDSVSNGVWVQTLSQLYKYTGNENYAFHAIRLLMNGFERIEGEYFIRSSGVFSTGNKIERIGQALTAIIYSEHMTPEVFTAFIKHFWMSNEWLANNWSYSYDNDYENSNLGIIPMTAGIEMALNFPEIKRAFDPVEGKKDISRAWYYGGWIPTYCKRLDTVLEIYIHEDGSSNDIPLEYAMYVFSNVISMLPHFEAHDFDYESYIPNFWKQLDKNILYIASKLSPGLGSWNNGDDTPYTAVFQKIFQMYLQHRTHPVAQYVGSLRKEGSPPEDVTTLNDIMAFAIMRSSWEANAVALHINADGGNVHGHQDDLHVSVYAYGQFLLVDPLNYNYDSTNPYTLWFNSTQGHNTVEINNTNQKGRTGYSNSSYTDIYGNTINTPIRQYGARGDLHPEDRETNDVYDYVLAETGGYIDNNALDGDFKDLRSVLFVKPGYFIVTDYIEPENENINSYRQNWHFLPAANISINDEGNTVTNFEEGANIIVAPLDMNDGMTASIEDGLLGHTPSGSSAEPAKGSRYTKHNAGITTFNTILYPVKEGETAEVSCEPLSLNVSKDIANAMSATIINTNAEPRQATYYTLFNKDYKEERTFGSFETDGTVAFVEKTTAEPTVTILRNGTSLKNKDGAYLIKSESEVPDIGVNYDYLTNTVSISSAHSEGDDAIDLTEITVFCDMEDISDVLFNGNSVKFERSGRYLYFGDVPIIEDEDEDKDKEESSSSAAPGHSTTTSGSNKGGSSSGSGGGSSVSVGGGGTVIPANPSLSEKFEKELSGHWGENEIKAMIEEGVVKGNGESLGLSDNVTRAEFITMLLRGMNKEIVKYSGAFSDVSEGAWYADFIQTAYNLGWISGDGEGNALPDKNITREEMAKILVSSGNFDEEEPRDLSEVSDGEAISEWARKYVSKALKLKLMQGADDGKFYPANNAKREEAIVVLYRLTKQKQ